MSDSDEESPTPNWDLLKETLSPSAYVELRSHLDNTADSKKNNTLLNRQEEVMLNSVFKEQSYWNQRFTVEEEYDWLVKTSQIAEYILPYVSRDDKILVVGCGNSLFSEELYSMVLIIHSLAAHHPSLVIGIHAFTHSLTHSGL